MSMNDSQCVHFRGKTKEKNIYCLLPLTLPVNLYNYVYMQEYGFSHSMARHMFPCVAG